MKERTKYRAMNSASQCIHKKKRLMLSANPKNPFIRRSIPVAKIPFWFCAVQGCHDLPSRVKSHNHVLGIKLKSKRKLKGKNKSQIIRSPD